jgi:hypothetical protein
MAAYLIVEHIVTDTAKFEEYRVKVGLMIAKYGGRYLTKGGSHKLPRGRPLEARARRHHRIPGHGRPQRLVHRTRISAAHQAAEECTGELDMLIMLEGAT